MGDRPKNDTIQPSTTGSGRGWSEEDTRIRLKLISRAWMQLRTARKHLELLPHSESTWPCRSKSKPHPLKVPKDLRTLEKRRRPIIIPRPYDGHLGGFPVSRWLQDGR